MTTQCINTLFKIVTQNRQNYHPEKIYPYGGLFLAHAEGCNRRALRAKSVHQGDFTGQTDDWTDGQTDRPTDRHTDGPTAGLRELDRLQFAPKYGFAYQYIP